MNNHVVNCKVHGPTPAYAQGSKRHCKKCNVVNVTNRRGLTRSLDKIRAEASKCDLICANCHREKHYDVD